MESSAFYTMKGYELAADAQITTAMEVSNLREKGLVTAQKYGEIHLTDSGRTFGRYLLYRHELLHQFLCFLNHSQNELEQVEKIEHFVDEKTVRSIQAFLDSLTRDGGT